MANYTIKDTFKQLGIKILGWLRSNCVNNCTSTSQSLPLAASQGKALQDQITTLNSNLTYNKGDNIIVNGISLFSGCISSAKAEIVFSIMLDKQISSNVKTISCVITNTTIRGVQGYILNNIDLSKQTNYTIFTDFYKNIVRIRIHLTEGVWNNSINNTPLSVMTNLTLTLS